MDRTLVKLLSLKRPNYDRHLQSVQSIWEPDIRSLLPSNSTEYCDAEGNLMALVFNQGGGRQHPKMLFSSHLDTVHRTTGYQRVVLRNSGFIETPDGECLGADDGAGVWLMLEMIKHKVPGSYIFHFSEEIGCLGSLWMRENHSEWLSQFNMVFGFDRPYCTDVITHFRGISGCAPFFALELGGALSGDFPTEYCLTPSSHGGATDVMQYIGLIPQCTNISVGYTQQHSCDEKLDWVYLQHLRDACIRVFPDYSPILIEECLSMSFAY